MSGIDYNLSLIRAFVFDVDGVLSPSTIPINNAGEPQRMANIKDGYAIQLACKLGYSIAIITGAKSENIKHRYNSLGVKDVFLGSETKIEVLKNWAEKMRLQPEEILYMGDDIPDYEPMNYVGLSCCPIDASNDILSHALYISPKQGGYGCVRDVMEQVLRSQGQWMHDEKAFGW